MSFTYAIGNETKYKGVFAYAGVTPAPAEMAAALAGLDTWGHFKKGPLDIVYLVFRRSLAAGGAASDFSVVAVG